MTQQRALAYKRVLSTLDAVGPSKLHAAEQQRVREAADALLFSPDGAPDAGAHLAVEDIERLCRGLVESGRWERPAAQRLADHVAQCGPPLLDDLDLDPGLALEEAA